MNELIAVEEDVRKIRRTPLPKQLRPEQRAIFPEKVVLTFAMKAFLALDGRLKGRDKALVNAVMSLMLYLWHQAEHEGRVNWWDQQMAGEAILEIVTRVELGMEVG